MKIKCPACAKVLSVPDSAAGKVVKCPCGKQLRAPAASPTSASTPLGSRPQTPSSPVTGNKPKAAANSLDPGIFDELTESDLGPVQSAANPYRHPNASPGAAAGAIPSARNQTLAGVGSRILGSIVDGFFYLGILVPCLVVVVLMFMPAQEGGEPTVGASLAGLAILGIGIILPTVVNCVLIAKSGQTIGKKIAGTRMVDQETGATVGFLQGYLLRTLVFSLITGVPVVGGFVAIADIIFLFIEGNQTLHDRLAKTRVVVA